MQLPAPVTVKWLAEFIGAELYGNTAAMATGINEIHQVQSGDISFVDLEKYYQPCLSSAATVIIIDKKTDFPEGKTLLVVKDPFDAYVKLVKHFRPFQPAEKMIADTAVIGADTIIQPNVFIGNHVQIGRGCIIHPHVAIYDYCQIGNNVIIHAGTVIGADAFYFKKRPEREVCYDKLESCGRVIIQDNVEIGAGCTIDKGVSGDTIIGQGTKLDNQIHIGHDTVIGKNCLFAAQVGIAGTTKIEDHVILWGQVGVSKDLTIGKNAVVLAQSGVSKTLKGDKVYMGYPADDARTRWKEIAWIGRIPEIWEKVKDK